MIGMFIPQNRNGQEKMVSVSVVKEDRIIYIYGYVQNLRAGFERTGWNIIEAHIFLMIKRGW